MRFFKIGHNSFDTHGYPWGMKVEGDTNHYNCCSCGAIIKEPKAEVDMYLEREKGNKWPDILGDGSQKLFTVSRRVLKDWNHEGIGELPAYSVTIQKPYPIKLEGTIPPEYFWIDGKKLFGARLDFEASGFVENRFCGECGRRMDNIKATYDRQRSAIWPYQFVEGSWNGLNLFTTDLSRRSFFCTEKIVICAHKYGHTNFRFLPIEWGGASCSKGLPYMKKGFTLENIIILPKN